VAGLTRKAIKQFKTLSDKTSATTLVISDDDQYLILFADNAALVGYTDKNILGVPLSDLLPEYLRETHPQMMERFKQLSLKTNPSEARGMAEGRTIEAVCKNGGTAKVIINIGYIQLADGTGYYVGFLQPDSASPLSLPELDLIKNNMISILEQIKTDIKNRIKVAVSGGVSGVVALILSVATPIWPAVHAGFKYFTQAYQAKGEPVVTAEIDSKTRQRRLYAVRDYLRRTDPDLIAIAYYRFEQSFGQVEIRWVADTEATDGKEVWFYDRVERKLTLTDKDLEAIAQQDCILKPSGAALINQLNSPKLDLILCPTFEIVEVDNLPQVRIKALIGGAYQPGIPLEPHAGMLWSMSPALETLKGQ
jgi:hypothetical protein